MTVASEVNRAGPYNGNGVTVVFAYGFRILDAGHLQVIKADADGNETTLILTSDYTVSGVGNAGGGSITLGVAPATGTTITILRNIPFTQETDLENQGAYYAQTVEDALDAAAMRDQQLEERMNRAVLVPASSADAGGELAARLATGILRLSESADEIDTVADNVDDLHTVSDNVDALKNVSENMAAVLAADGSALYLLDRSYVAEAGQVAFTLPAAAVSDENVLVWVGRVRQVPGVDYTTDGNSLVLSSAPGDGVSVDTLSIAAVSFGTIEDMYNEIKSAATFLRQMVTCSEGVTRYTLNSSNSALNLTQTNHILFGGSPFGPLTYGVDYVVSGGGIDLLFSPRGGELLSIFSMPRFANSEAQVVLQEYKDAVAEEVAELNDAAADLADWRTNGATKAELADEVGALNSEIDGVSGDVTALSGSTDESSDVIFARRGNGASVLSGIPVLTTAEATALSPNERRKHRFYFISDGASPGLKLRENLPAFTHGSLSITKEYDSGMYQTSGSTISGGDITFRAFPTGFAQRTLRAKVGGLYGVNPVFYLTHRSEWASSGGATRLPLLWADNPHSDVWLPFDNASVDEANNRWVFSMDQNWPVETIYLADDINYSVGRWNNLIEDLILSPFSRPTASAVDGYRIGTYTARSAPTQMYRTAPAIDQYAFRVGHGPRVAVITGGVHPDETRGMYTFEGFVRSIIAGTAKGRALREEYTFLIYPAINSQGVWTGMIRGDIEINQDANRIWNHPTHSSEMTVMYQAAITTDLVTAGRLDAVMDFHDDSRNTTAAMVWHRFAAVADHPANTPFIESLGNYRAVANFDFTADYTLMDFVKSLGAPALAVVVEHGRQIPMDAQGYRDYGRDIAQALIDSTPHIPA